MIKWISNLLAQSKEAEQRQKWWDARVATLETMLGRCDGTVFYAPSPLHRDGFADVLRFREFAPGIAYVTCDLIGNPRQTPNKWGHYELMICMREESNWAAHLLSRLGQYTLDTTLQPGDTMDLADARPKGSRLAALLFARPDPPLDSFNVLGAPANLILCIGLNEDEFTDCKNFGSGVMLRMLKDKEVYPFTDLNRASVT